MKSIVSIVLIVVAGIIFFLFTNPHFVTVKTLRAEEQRFDDALDRSKELIALRDALLQKYNSIPSGELDRINAILPDAVDTVRLIIEINGIAARHGMTLMNIGVGDVTASSETGRLGPANKAYGTVSLSFDVTANYDRFRTFIADLERNLRLLDITSISFGTPTGAGNTTYSVLFDTYWMN